VAAAIGRAVSAHRDLNLDPPRHGSRVLVGWAAEQRRWMLLLWVVSGDPVRVGLVAGGG
jgi:hypothetical protein